MIFLFFAIDYNIKVGFLFSEKRTLEIYHFSPTAPPEDSKQNVPPLLRQKKKSPGGGGGYCHIWAIWACAAVKGMVFKQFTLG